MNERAGDKADLILVNGQVVTCDAGDRVVEAVAVGGNRILAAGGNDEIRAWRGRGTRVVDLHGRSLVPGLIDAHCHLVLFGLYLSGLDCRYPTVKSIADLQRQVRRAAQDASPGEWVVGWGYNHKKLAEERHPTREELDEVAPRNPVLLVRTDYHTSVANSEALAREGIGADTADPPGGRIGRGDDGSPNGLLVDAAHMRMMKWAMPDAEGFRRAIQAAGRRYLELGVTTVHDAGGFGWPQFQAFKRAWEAGELPVRLYALLFSLFDPAPTTEHFTGTGLGSGLGDAWFRLGHMKFMIDGSSSGPSAAVRRPYDSCPCDSGILYYSQDELSQVMTEAVRHGFDITAHAVGDRGVEMVITAIESARAALVAGQRWRPRIEHCGIVDEALLDRIEAAGIVPIPQPAFCYDFGDGYLRDYGERTRYMFAGRSFIDHGIAAAGSSDCPVTDANPWLGIHTAVNRRTQNGAAIGPQEAIGVMDALHMYTRHAAYAAYDEHVKGSIEAGKLADLVVLSEPVLECAPERLKDVRAAATIVDGRIVHDAGL